jgi:predicted LPLAT superfamily acyltransferase
MDPARKIAAQRRGNALGFAFFKASLRLFGLRGAYGLLYFVCAYYLVCDRRAVCAALAYVRRRFPHHSPVRHRWDVYRLFIEQGKNLIDRSYLLAGGQGLASHLEGLQQADEILKSGQGFILLTAHLGNWQVVMSALRRFGRKVHLLMRPEDNPAVAEALRISTDGEGVSIISPEEDLGGVLAIMKAIQHGDIVSIMGDRSYNFSSVDVTFLGDPARFSCGAFHIAALAQCPVVVLLAAKTSVHDYVVSVRGVFHPAYQPAVNKKLQLRGWVQEFARLMEGYVEAYPYQCFLFHDIWRDAEPCTVPPAAVTPRDPG